MKKILTVILDGFGIREETHGNAIKDSNMPYFNSLLSKYPNSLLSASEESVGLPKGQFGNSEVGHMIIGAGRYIKHQATRIDEFLEDEIDNDEDFLEMLKNIKDNNSNVHLIGLCSDGGVHSLYRHFFSILKKFKQHNVSNIYLHLITDGRDTYSKDSMKYILDVQKNITEIGVGKIASICGRYYAMDRDQNYSRTKTMYDLITKGIGLTTNNLKETIEKCYQKKVTDEFLPPILINPNGIIKDNDVAFWINYRSDRGIQLMESLSDKGFNKFPTKMINNLQCYSFFPIDKKVNVHSLLENEEINNSLGKYFSDLGLSQARIAETEKYSHVTKFFDGLYQGNLNKCDKFLIPSPKVATYDLKPEMSALEITQKVIQCMEKDYDFILVNYANPDMVGHTGNMEATIKALEILDKCLEKVIESSKDNFYTAFILGDHGNADIMLDDEDRIVTTHTISKVPFIITDTKVEVKDGDLTNVAPTILKYMDISLPKEMKNTNNLFK